MGVRGGGVATVHALHGEAVAGESVIGLFGYELFEHLTAGFLLFCHGGVSYYTGGAGGIQLRAGARGSNEAEKWK